MRQRNFFDIFFTLSLMSVFVLCSTLLLFFQIDRFQQQKANNEEQEKYRLAQSYLTMNFHQRNADRIELQKIMGVDCIVIKNDTDNTSKLIYVYDGYLRELYQSQQANVDLAIGDKITPVKEMQIQNIDTLYTFDLEFEHTSNQLKLSTY